MPNQSERSASREKAVRHSAPERVNANVVPPSEAARGDARDHGRKATVSESGPTKDHRPTHAGENPGVKMPQPPLEEHRGAA